MFDEAVAEVESIIYHADRVSLMDRPKKSISNFFDQGKKPRKVVANNGYCIRCREVITYNPDHPYCYDCYSEWADYQNDEYEDNFCHACGDDEDSSMKYPLCDSCYGEHGR